MLEYILLLKFFRSKMVLLILWKYHLNRPVQGDKKQLWQKKGKEKESNEGEIMHGKAKHFFVLTC